ncbi:MAG: hypothetical protein ACFB21_13620 [Opitutales bacterium]
MANPLRDPPGSYRFEWTENSLIARFFGVIDRALVLKAIDERIGDPRFDNVQYLITDLREVTALPMEDIDLRAAKFYATASELAGQQRWNVAAFVVKPGPIEVAARRFCELAVQTGSRVHRRVFVDFDEAEAWASTEASNHSR